MMEAVLEKDQTIAHLVGLARVRSSGRPEWLNALQDRALLSFEQQGFPTRRDEAWKYTDLRSLGGTTFDLPEPVEAGSLRDFLEASPFAALGEVTLVFVNGVYSPELSNQAPLPNGISARSLQQVLAETPESLESHFGQYAIPEEDSFVALNTAFVSDGAVVEIPDGQVVNETIELVFLNTPTSASPVLVTPRVIVTCGRNSEARIVETHLGVADGASYLSSAVTELIAKENASLDHYKIQLESLDSHHVGNLQTHMERSARVRNTMITLMGGLIRNNTSASMLGEGGWAELDGLYLGAGEQHVDNFTRIDHRKPHCDSRELYKGVLTDHATGVFCGRIVVAEDAQKTDSKQTNNSLLLSESAAINAKPQLEIYADDVKCTHGATIGQLDQDAIFYLRARGISLKDARSMLIYAFANEVAKRVKLDSLRDVLDEYLLKWLPGAENEG